MRGLSLNKECFHMKTSLRQDTAVPDVPLQKSTAQPWSIYTHAGTLHRSKISRGDTRSIKAIAKTRRNGPALSRKPGLAGRTGMQQQQDTAGVQRQTRQDVNIELPSLSRLVNLTFQKSDLETQLPNSQTGHFQLAR